jgi:type IV secretory pathway protease TraF
MLKNISLNVKKMSSKKLVAMAVAYTLIVGIGIQVPKYLSYSFSDSVGHNLFFFKKGTPEKIENGDFVIFDLKVNPSLVPNCNPCKVTKIVGCVSGQKLTTEGPRFFCDGKYLGTAKESSSKGVPVKQFEYNGLVPQNQFFTTGTSGDSYDSKYYGFIKKEKIEGTAIPVL